MNQICCQKCRGGVSYNTPLCPHCGWDQRIPYLPDTSELHKTFIPIHDPQAISVSEVRCPTCGATRNVEYSDGSLFCATCGENITQVFAGRKKSIIALISSVLAVSVALGLVMLYKDMKEKGSSPTQLKRQTQDPNLKVFDP